MAVWSLDRPTASVAVAPGWGGPFSRSPVSVALFSSFLVLLLGAVPIGVSAAPSAHFPLASMRQGALWIFVATATMVKGESFAIEPGSQHCSGAGATRYWPFPHPTLGGLPWLIDPRMPMDISCSVASIPHFLRLDSFTMEIDISRGLSSSTLLLGPNITLYRGCIVTIGGPDSGCGLVFELGSSRMVATKISDGDWQQYTVTCGNQTCVLPDESTFTRPVFCDASNSLCDFLSNGNSVVVVGPPAYGAFRRIVFRTPDPPPSPLLNSDATIGVSIGAGVVGFLGICCCVHRYMVWGDKKAKLKRRRVVSEAGSVPMAAIGSSSAVAAEGANAHA